MLESAPGGRGQILLNDGWAAAGRGELAEAERLFLAALEAVPDLSMAWEGVIRIRIQTERYEEASRALDGGRGAGLDPWSGDIYECVLAVQRGDLAAARKALERIRDEPSPRDPVLAGLLDSARHTLDEKSRAR